MTVNLLETCKLLLRLIQQHLNKVAYLGVYCSRKIAASQVAQRPGSSRWSRRHHGARRGASIIFLLVLVVAIAGGCWDRVEIEDRAFVLAVGLDVPLEDKPDPEGNKEVRTAPPGLVQTQPIRLTAQMSLPILLPTAGMDGGGGGGQPPFWNLITVTRGSISLALQEINMRSSKTVDLSHIQAIVFSEEIARRGIGYTLDYFLRDPEGNIHTGIFVTRGTAVEALAIKPKQDFTGALYLTSLAQQEIVTSRFSPVLTLAEVSRLMHEEGCFLLPWVEVGKDEVKLSGSAVFKNRQLIGHFDEVETEGARWLMGRLKGGQLEMNCPRHPGVVEVMKIDGSRTRIIPRLEDDQLSFEVRIRVEGSLVEHQDADDVTDINYIRELEEVSRTRIKDTVQQAVSRMQELNVDGCFYRELERRFPQVWRQMKDRWMEDVFPAVPVVVRPEVYIRRPGTVR